MERIDLSADQPAWSELIGRAEAGETIDLVREGRVTARLVPVRDPRVTQAHLKALRAFRETVPFQKESAADVIREMRDSRF